MWTRDEPRLNMLKFLTHKLRTHSLNEENVSEKVGVGRLRAAKVAPPPENGRRSREQRSGTIASLTARGPLAPRGPRRLDASRRRDVPSGDSRAAAVRDDYRQRPESEEPFLLQVEERDSGTESDDEADRADTGECPARGRAGSATAHDSRAYARSRLTFAGRFCV